ncbi:MAG TPA: alpha/beta hydrolase family protein [Candidatus Anammoximicrobium sp.]|nr:alpha/beta hydrolase family protein [Candidatus Anammoximicrobium sp.]
MMRTNEPCPSELKRREFLVQSAAGAAVLWASESAALAAAAGEQGRGTVRQEGRENAKMPAKEFREKLLQCLGGPWPPPCELKPVLRETIRKDGYRIESVFYEVEPGDRVPAMLLVPDGVDAEHPAPAVAIWHQHNGEWHLGKTEPAGLAGNPMHHTGVALVREGYVVLCPDALCFEERQSPDLKGGNFERFEFLRYVVAGKCMAWKNILDMRRAVDYLCQRPEVDEGRIGCYGHSMGSTHTWLVGPWEPRLKCLVGNCCLPTYAAIHRTRLLHCFPNFVPGLFQYGDTPDIAALIAPRALHLNFGELDGGSPIQEVREGVQRIARAYAEAGVPENFSWYVEDGAGHVLSPEMWQRTRDWFAKHLKD